MLSFRSRSIALITNLDIVLVPERVESQYHVHTGTSDKGFSEGTGACTGPAQPLQHTVFW